MGHKTIGGHVDPTIIITRYLKSQSRQKDVFFTYTLMLELCKAHIDKMGKKTGPERAFPKEQDLLANFLVEQENISSQILSFFVGYGDLRNATKELLLELGLQKQVLREELNGNSHQGNECFWGVRVDSRGEVVVDGD